MGLRIKIISGFIILALMLTIAGVWTIIELKSAGASIENILEENYKSIEAAKAMRESIERQDKITLLLLLTQNSNSNEILIKARNEFFTALETAKKNITIQGENEYVDSLGTKYSIYISLWEELLENNIITEKKEWYLNKSHPRLVEIINLIEKIEDLNSNALYNTSLSIRSKSERAIVPGIVAVLSAIIFTLIFNYLINFYVINPINKSTEAINDFIEKKVPYQYNIDSGDEIEKLTEAIYRLSSYVEFDQSKR